MDATGRMPATRAEVAAIESDWFEDVMTVHHQVLRQIASLEGEDG